MPGQMLEILYALQADVKQTKEDVKQTKEDVKQTKEDVKQTKEDVKQTKATMNKLTATDHSGTASHHGLSALKGCAHKKDLPDDGSKVVDKALATDNESATLAELFPILQSLLPEGLCLGDSQECNWLPQGLSLNKTTYLKPDGFVICRAFVANVGTEGGKIRQLPTLENSFFSCLRCLVEGKHNSCKSSSATGQAYLYASKLEPYVPILHILLIDSRNFRAESWDHGVLVGLVDGTLTGNGSKEFLSKFLLGAGSTKDDFLLPEEPKIDELEVAQRALALLTSYELDKIRPVLGVGGTAVVLNMRKDSNQVAVKVMRPSLSAQFLLEEAIYSRLSKMNTMQIAKLVESHGDGRESSYLVLTPVGEALPREENMIVSGVLALCEFHRLGFAHKDARRQNFIKARGKAFLIDFSHSNELGGSQEIAAASRCDDIARFLSSIITEKLECENLQCPWFQLMPPTLMSAIKSFSQGQCSYEEAQSLVKLALEVL
jgi:hypothetical protein